jgi:hypothetical protein
VNFGIYAILAEQAILGVVIGVAALVTPDGEYRGATFTRVSLVGELPPFDPSSSSPLSQSRCDMGR